MSAVALLILTLFQDDGTRNTVFTSAKTLFGSFFLSQTEVLADFYSKNMVRILHEGGKPANKKKSKIRKFGHQGS